MKTLKIVGLTIISLMVIILAVNYFTGFGYYLPHRAIFIDENASNDVFVQSHPMFLVIGTISENQKATQSLESALSSEDYQSQLSTVPEGYKFTRIIPILSGGWQFDFNGTLNWQTYTFTIPMGLTIKGEPPTDEHYSIK